MCCFQIVYVSSPSCKYDHNKNSTMESSITGAFCSSEANPPHYKCFHPLIPLLSPGGGLTQFMRLKDSFLLCFLITSDIWDGILPYMRQVTLSHPDTTHSGQVYSCSELAFRTGPRQLGRLFSIVLLMSWTAFLSANEVT